MAYAWNPTLQGAKSEETVLVTGDELETLTRTGQWPTATVHSSGHAVALERPDILYRDC